MSAAHCLGHHTPGAGLTPCPDDWHTTGDPDDVDKAAAKAAQAGHSTIVRSGGGR